MLNMVKLIFLGHPVQNMSEILRSPSGVSIEACATIYSGPYKLLAKDNQNLLSHFRTWFVGRMVQSWRIGELEKKEQGKMSKTFFWHVIWQGATWPVVQSIRGPHGLLLLPAFSPTKPDTATPCQPPRQSPPPPPPSPPPWCCCATRSSIWGQILQRINRDADYRCTILPQLLATLSTFSTLPPKFPFPGSVEADFLHSMAFQTFQSCTLLYFRDGKPKYHFSLSICKPISKEECAC